MAINLGDGFDGVAHINDIVGLIDQHCKSIKLLSFDGRIFDYLSIERYSEFLGRLESVHIIGGFLAINYFLNLCAHLKVLESMMNVCLDLTDVSLPRLIELNLQFFKCHGMGEFLIRHPHIEKLTMVMPDNIVTYSLSDDINEFIFDNLPNIREMKIFEISQTNIARLSDMRNLKSVYLNFDMKPFGQIMKKLSSKNTPIEILELARGFIDDNAIKYICEMKTITKINFFQCIGFDKNKLGRLAHSLPNLRALSECSGAMLNLDEILPILKKRHIEWFNEISHDDKSYILYVS